MEKQLTLNEYQELAMRTCMQSCNNFSYMMLNLVGEVGELASKVAKDIRKENVRIRRMPAPKRWSVLPTLLKLRRQMLWN